MTNARRNSSTSDPAVGGAVLGHLAALRKLDETKGCACYNLGTGTGRSNLEVLRGIEEVVGLAVPYRRADTA